MKKPTLEQLEAAEARANELQEIWGQKDSYATDSPQAMREAERAWMEYRIAATALEKIRAYWKRG